MRWRSPTGLVHHFISQQVKVKLQVLRQMCLISRAAKVLTGRDVTCIFCPVSVLLSSWLVSIFTAPFLKAAPSYLLPLLSFLTASPQAATSSIVKTIFLSVAPALHGWFVVVRSCCKEFPNSSNFQRSASDCCCCCNSPSNSNLKGGEKVLKKTTNKRNKRSGWGQLFICFFSVFLLYVSHNLILHNHIF